MTVTPSQPVSTARTTSWSVHYRHRDPRHEDRDRGIGPETASARLATTQALRHHFALQQPHLFVPRIIEHTDVISSSPMELADLPAPGVPTPPPALPEGAYQVTRFYRFRLCGPYVLPTGDAVRRWHRWAQENPHIHTELLRLQEVTITRYHRTIAQTELPVCPCCP